MTDTPAAVDTQTAELIEYRAGHYMSAVARLLLNGGLPVTQIYAEAPHMEEYPAGVRYLVDCEAALSFSAELRAQLSEVSQAALGWDAQSGWHIQRETDGPEEYRWLGQGLVPAPDRVAAFLASAQMEYATAGSEEKPYYRQDGDPYTDVLDRLAAYVPHDPNQPERKYDWKSIFAADRRAAYERRVLDALLIQEPDPVLSIPLRRSEVRALALCLEWFEPDAGFGCGEVISSLQMDLTRRIPGDLASADAEREALHFARVRMESLTNGNP